VQQILVGRDIKLYYDPQQTSQYKHLDWFAVVGVDPCYEQRDLITSYQVWQEGINPFVVVELHSSDREINDLEQRLPTKNPSMSNREVYEQILRIPYYILFDSKTNHLRAFQLVDNHYKELKLSDPRIWMNGVQLGLGLWQGTYHGIHRRWLRWYDGSLKWILTHEEREQKRAELLAKQLIMLGIEDGNS
jgi:Uma2 family endonuclease